GGGAAGGGGAGGGGREPLRPQLRRRLPREDRDTAADPRQRLLERLGLRPRTCVLGAGRASTSLLANGGAGGTAILPDVLVPSSPDPRLQQDGLILVEAGEPVALGLRDEQALGVVEDREERRIHLFLRFDRECAAEPRRAAPRPYLAEGARR